jgi:probable phosphoglycerate mutase
MTKLGYQQAEQLARWAISAAPDAIYSSDLSRAIATAQPAAAGLGLELVVDSRLREVDFGRAEGLTRSEMATAFPLELAAFMANPGTTPLPGGEPGANAVERARTALLDIASGQPDGAVLVVMHTTLMRLLLCHLLGMPLDSYRTAFPKVINAAITQLDYDGKGWALMNFNLPTA